MSATSSRPSKKATPKTATAPKAKLSPAQMVAKMDRLLPKSKLYNEDRKAKVPREKRRGLKEYGEFEKLYTQLRASGLKLRDARPKKEKPSK
jgi:hypothetical protein